MIRWCMLFVAVLATSVVGEEAAQPVVQNASGITAILAQSALLVLQIAGPVLATLIGLGVVKLLKLMAAKVNVQWSDAMDEQVRKAVASGVSAAEQWAISKGENKPTGNQKADFALNLVRDLLETDTYKQYGETALRGLIEGAVAKLNGASVEAPVVESSL